LFALAGLLIVSGYTGDWASGEKSLAEATLFESEDQIRDASAYITRVYEEERRSLARDLHDEVGHDLMLMKLHLEMIALDCQKRSKGMSEFQPRVAEALALVSHSIDSIRRIDGSWDPRCLTTSGSSQRSLTSAKVLEPTKINVVLHEGYIPATVPMAHQVALYRLIQGALANVYKHASAKNVEVTLRSRKGSVLVMVIEDDGVGFDPKARFEPGTFGLTAMRERAEVLGGRLRIESRQAGTSPRQGTRIEVDLPLPEGPGQ
jgi:signal transduction histidine kinase